MRGLLCRGLRVVSGRCCRAATVRERMAWLFPDSPFSLHAPGRTDWISVRLPLDPRHELPVTGPIQSVDHVDKAKPAGLSQAGIERRRLVRVGSRGRGQGDPVESVEQLYPNVEAHPILLEGEAASDAELLVGVAHPAV